MNDRNPKVSVIIPVHNVKPFVRQCLDSFVSQTLVDIEAVCIDDGSTDGSGELLDEYAQKDSRITVIHQENLGVAHARNRGIDASKGEYVLAVDSDDYLVDTALEKLYHRAKEHDADVCVFDAQDIMCETGKPLFKNYFSYTRFKALGDSFEPEEQGARFFDSISTVCWIKMVRRSMLIEQNIRFELRESFEDIMWSILTVALAQRITYVPEKLLFHRTYRSGSLLNTVDDHIEDPVNSCRSTFEELRKRGVLTEKVRINGFLNKTAGLYYYTLRNFNDYGRLSEYWDLINGEKTILAENAPYEYDPETPDLNKYMKWRNRSIEEYFFDQYKHFVSYSDTIRHEIEKTKHAYDHTLKKIERLEADKKELVAENDELKRKSKRQKKKIKDIRKSKTFRLGKAILYVPRKIKKLF